MAQAEKAKVFIPSSEKSCEPAIHDRHQYGELHRERQFPSFTRKAGRTPARRDCVHISDYRGRTPIRRRKESKCKDAPSSPGGVLGKIQILP